ETVGPAARAGDPVPAVACGVTALPLVGVADGPVRPGAVVLGQRLPLPRAARDRGRRSVDGQRRGDTSCWRGGGRATRAARVARRLLNADRVFDVFGCEHICLAGGAGYGQAAVAKRVALQPLVGVARGTVRPRAVGLGQRLALLRRAADRRRRGVHWHRWQHDGGLRGGGRRTRAGRVACGLLHADRVGDVGGDEHVGLVGGAGDGGAAVAFGVAALPLVGEAGGAVR